MSSSGTFRRSRVASLISWPDPWPGALPGLQGQGQKTPKTKKPIKPKNQCFGTLCQPPPRLPCHSVPKHCFFLFYWFFGFGGFLAQAHARARARLRPLALAVAWARARKPPKTKKPIKQKKQMFWDTMPAPSPPRLPCHSVPKHCFFVFIVFLVLGVFWPTPGSGLGSGP